LSTPSHELNAQSKGSLKLNVYPNPNKGMINIEYHLKETKDIRLKIVDLKGELIENKLLSKQMIGKNSYKLNIEGKVDSGVILVSIETPYETARQKIILNR
jgi:hypothetical protein